MKIYLYYSPEIDDFWEIPEEYKCKECPHDSLYFNDFFTGKTSLYYYIGEL